MFRIPISVPFWSGGRLGVGSSPPAFSSHDSRIDCSLVTFFSWRAQILFKTLFSQSITHFGNTKTRMKALRNVSLLFLIILASINVATSLRPDKKPLLQKGGFKKSARRQRTQELRETKLFAHTRWILSPMEQKGTYCLLRLTGKSRKRLYLATIEHTFLFRFFTWNSDCSTSSLVRCVFLPKFYFSKLVPTSYTLQTTRTIGQRVCCADGNKSNIIKTSVVMDEDNKIPFPIIRPTEQSSSPVKHQIYCNNEILIMDCCAATVSCFSYRMSGDMLHHFSPHTSSSQAKKTRICRFSEKPRMTSQNVNKELV